MIYTWDEGEEVVIAVDSTEGEDAEGVDAKRKSERATSKFVWQWTLKTSKQWICEVSEVT